MLAPCPTIADNLVKGEMAAIDFNAKITELNGTIEAARRHYWAVFPNGPGFDAAEKQFLRALEEKDLYYLMFALQQGMTGDIAKMANAIGVLGGDRSIKSIDQFPSNLDQGIRPYAMPLFAAWVGALRRSEGREKDGTWASPVIIAAAVQDNSNWRRAYEDARNWAEFISSGKDISQYITPQAYLRNQIEADVSMVLARAKPSDLPNPASASLDLYNTFVKIFGEKEVAAAASTVLHTPKNSVGGLATRAEVSIGTFESAGSPNPYLLFLTQLTNRSPHNYAVALCIDQNALLGGEATAAFNTKDRWTNAASVYGQLVARFGEPAVLAAAARMKDIPKDDSGGPKGDPEAKGGIYWFTALLKDPKTQLPELSQFLASSYDPRWMGKMVEVRGTVARVELDTNGFPRYATIHFKEAKNDRFMAFTPNSDLLDSYGQNYSGLVGKPIEISGQVEDWREGAGVRFLGANQFKVLDTSALANFRESSPEWMKAPLPANNLVDSPKYLAWKKFQPGAKARYENDLLYEYKPGTNQYTKTKISSTTFTLQSIDDERAIVKVESTVSHRGGGDTYSSSQQIYKAKQAAPGPRTGDPSHVTTNGEEMLVINGKKIPSKWEMVSKADDPMTFTKTWTSDEVPGGLVRTQQQSHQEITGQTYRSISHTLYAPVDGVEPQLGDVTSAAPASRSVAPTAAGNPGTAPPNPSGRPAAAGVPATPVQSQPDPAPPQPLRGRRDPNAASSAAAPSDFLNHYNAVMRRASQDRLAFMQLQRRLYVTRAPLPDDLRLAQDQLNTEQRAVASAMRMRDYAAGEDGLRSMEDTLTTIEKFLGN